MKGFQKAHLRGIGQTLRPAIHVGKKGIDEGFFNELNRIFAQHELVKIKFAPFVDEKPQLATRIAETTGSTLVETIGHTALLYRENPDPQKREIRLPQRPSE